MDADRRRDVGLFRYSIVRELAAMSPRARGRAVRELAGREHLTPWGERVRVSRVTLDRWVRAWREGGFDALVPTARDGVPRTPAGLLELAVALKREAPERTGAQIARIIGEREGAGPAERTLLRGRSEQRPASLGAIGQGDRLSSTHGAVRTYVAAQGWRTREIYGHGRPDPSEHETEVFWLPG
jgi:transposase